jgi:hypothetical protein
MSSSLPVREWLRKAAVRGARYDKTTFADLPRAVFWLRMVLGVSCGIAAGAAPLTGWSGFILFGATAFGLVMLFLGPAYLDIDFTEFDQSEILQEGSMPAFAIHMVRGRQ